MNYEGENVLRAEQKIRFKSDQKSSPGSEIVTEFIDVCGSILKHTRVLLFFCGLFLIYVASFDETLFRLFAFDVTNRIIVSLATILAASLPMFFAVGAIKHSVLISRETIYYYEKFLKTWVFWLCSGILCVSIGVLAYTQFRFDFLSKTFVIVGGLLSGVYFIYYSSALMRRRRF
jgi:hypothetical protein